MTERGNLECQQTELLLKGYMAQPPGQPVRHALWDLIFVVDNNPTFDANSEQQLSEFRTDGVMGAIAQGRDVFDLVDFTQGAVRQHPQGNDFVGRD